MCSPDETNEKVTIKKGQSFGYRTQAGEKYGEKVKCMVTYKVMNESILKKGLKFVIFAATQEMRESIFFMFFF